MRPQSTLPSASMASLWAATAVGAQPRPPLTEHVDADVAIIGAGFTGLRAAVRLAEAGTTVVVLDGHDVGYGASGRTGGQVNPMLPFNTPDKLRRLLGDTYFDRLTETSLQSADELFTFIRDYQIDCQARQNGWLRVCHNDRALARAKEGIDAWTPFGAELDVVTGEELTRLSGTKAYQSGVVARRGGAVQPLSLALGLAAAAEDRGAVIHGNSAVTDLVQGESGRWIVTTAAGQVNAGCVIVATNGYTDSLVPKLSRSILPLIPIQIATNPLPKSMIGEVLPDGHTISDSRRVIMYARREPDDRIVYGGLGHIDRDGQFGGFDWLIKDVERVFPQLRGVEWTYRWGGRIALTEDSLPHLHEPQKGLFVGLGYNGRGVAMSNVMGRVLAERALGAPAESLPFPVSQIQAYPMRSLTMTSLGTAVWFMRLLDSLEWKR